MTRLRIPGSRHQSNAFAQRKLSIAQTRLSKLLDTESGDDHDPQPEEYEDSLDTSLEILLL